MYRTHVLSQFDELGYALLEDVLDPKEDLAPIIRDYDALLDTLAEQWFSDGLIPSAHRGLPFEQRFAAVALGASAAGINWIQHFDFSFPQGGVTAETPVHHSEAVFNLLTNPRLLDVAERLIGPEIVVNPIHHVRLKPPEDQVPTAMRGGLTARTPWHQDQGVALPEADQSDILTVWLPLTEATIENGCLSVVPGSHRGELITHCPGVGGVQIPERLLAGAATPLPMRPGSVLLLHRLTQHSSLTNVSQGIRWSLDLRYQPADQPTGRPAFPAFLARSRAHPERVVTDWRDWAAMWEETRAAMMQRRDPVFNRWSAAAPLCA
jgi:ectoine hydroxylase-related dioxygenase (phytanoyl-CoA dioxygenase family)